MPRDLPGLYWDEERGRYFPLSSRPPSQTSQPVASTSSQHITPGPRRHVSAANAVDRDERPKKRRRTENLINRGSMLGLCRSSTYASMCRSVHDVMSHSILSLSQGKVVSYGDFRFSSFQVTQEPDGSFSTATGDDGGWLHTYKTDSRGVMLGSSRELYLGSTVTSLCRSSAYRLVASFGPSSRIAVQNTVQDAELWTIVRMPDTCYDVRAAHLMDRSLALGASRKGVLLPDIETSWHYEILATGSDVFSVVQQGPLVYAGTRSGSVKAFDRRLGSQQKAQELLGGRYTEGSRTITHLSVLHEWQLLVSTISGDLELHDLRFGRNTVPFMQLDGHINTYIADIGFCVSPNGEYVFAAGQDRRIRAWSLLTGNMLSPTPSQDTKSYDDDFSEPLHQQFADSVVALQVTEGGGGSDYGMSLWALSGKKVYRYWLGQSIRDAGEP